LDQAKKWKINNCIGYQMMLSPQVLVLIHEE
jgi:hypothetical protein